jgi:hypothetical protein
MELMFMEQSVEGIKNKSKRGERTIISNQKFKIEIKIISTVKKCELRFHHFGEIINSYKMVVAAFRLRYHAG